MPLLLQKAAGHFENVPVYEELLNPPLLRQVSKEQTKGTLNHGKELDSK